MPDNSRLNRLLQAIDQANAQDPNLEQVSGQTLARELIYGQRMSARLAAFTPDASEHLRIAARAQHIERWMKPRADYPEGRIGYRKWRTDLGVFHAQRAGALMTAHGYGNDDVERVQSLLQKRHLHQDTEAQRLEDIACLVFIEYYLADFAKKHPRDKIISIIQKTWKKMSPEGHQAALVLPLAADLTTLVTEAVRLQP